MFPLPLLLVLLPLFTQSPTSGGDGAPLAYRVFEATQAGEAIAVVSASCERCDWGVEGREAAALRISFDGRYSQHLLLTRGSGTWEYQVTLGPVSPGTHRLFVHLDATLSARDTGKVTVGSVSTHVIAAGSDEHLAQAMAPFVYARPDTVGRFTDVPVFMWYEIVPVPLGRQFRYSAIFSNEDGGTATDRLMATWGRTTDIEYIYGATVDSQGKVVAEEFQGPGHEVPPFRGRHEGLHPLQWVSTINNMVSESGPTEIRYAPVPVKFDLTNVSRETVMDAHPWTHVLASKEMVREKKLSDTAAPGSGIIPDPRRFVFVEACTALQNAAVAFAVGAKDASGELRWFESDRGLPQFRIVRTGCFRGAVPLPPGASPEAIRLKAYALPTRPNAAAAAGTPAVTLIRVNRVFTLGDDYVPQKSLFGWTGSSRLAIDGDPVQFSIRP
jgi:hypothetical protein